MVASVRHYTHESCSYSGRPDPARHKLFHRRLPQICHTRFGSASTQTSMYIKPGRLLLVASRPWLANEAKRNSLLHKLPVTVVPRGKEDVRREMAMRKALKRA